jgi:hypothetical protein
VVERAAACCGSVAARCISSLSVAQGRRSLAGHDGLGCLPRSLSFWLPAAVARRLSSSLLWAGGLMMTGDCFLADGDA